MFALIVCFQFFTNPLYAGFETIETDEVLVLYEGAKKGIAEEIAGVYPAVKKDLEEDSEKWGILLDSLLRYFDGSLTILDIAEKHDLPFDRLYSYLLRFQEKNLIRLEFAPIERVPISKIQPEM